MITVRSHIDKLFDNPYRFEEKKSNLMILVGERIAKLTPEMCRDKWADGVLEYGEMTLDDLKDFDCLREIEFELADTYNYHALHELKISLFPEFDE